MSKIYIAKEVKANYASSSYPDSGASKATTCIVNGSNTYQYRSFLQHDFSGIPCGSKIISAKLYVYASEGNDNTAQGGHKFDAVISEWEESSNTWNNQASVANTPIPAEWLVPTIGAWNNWDITALVQKWIYQVMPNNGLMFVNKDETGYRHNWKFYNRRQSEEYATYVEVEYEPIEQWCISHERMVEIADAIRIKTGKTESLTVEQMVTEINSIEAGSGGLNIIYSEEVPEDTSALWIKSNEPNKVTISPQITLKDIPTLETIVDGIPWGIGNIGVAVIDNAIWYYGGGSPAVVVYYPETKTAVMKGEVLPAIIDTSATAVIDKKIYIFGGRTNGTAKNYAWCYDTETNTAVDLGVTLASADWGMRAIAVDKKIYIFGGYSNSYRIQVYDTETNLISVLSNTLPSSFNVGEIYKYNNKIYLIGGWISSASQSVMVFDYETNTAKTLSNVLAAKFSYGASGIIGSKVYLLGGRQSTSSTNEILTIDLDTLKSEKLSLILPIPLCYTGSATIGDKIYILGGHDTSTNTWYRDVIVFEQKCSLPENEIQIENEIGTEFTLSSGIVSQPMGIRNVYRGNANNEAEKLEAYLYINNNWKCI